MSSAEVNLTPEPKVRVDEGRTAAPAGDGGAVNLADLAEPRERPREGLGR